MFVPGGCGCSRVGVVNACVLLVVGKGTDMDSATLIGRMLAMVLGRGRCCCVGGAGAPDDDDGGSRFEGEGPGWVLGGRGISSSLN